MFGEGVVDHAHGVHGLFGAVHVLPPNQRSHVGERAVCWWLGDGGGSIEGVNGDETISKEYVA